MTAWDECGAAADRYRYEAVLPSFAMSRRSEVGSIRPARSGERGEPGIAVVIRAPQDGRIKRKPIRIGEHVRPRGLTGQSRDQAHLSQVFACSVECRRFREELPPLIVAEVQNVDPALRDDPTVPQKQAMENEQRLTILGLRAAARESAPTIGPSVSRQPLKSTHHARVPMARRGWLTRDLERADARRSRKAAGAIPPRRLPSL